MRDNEASGFFYFKGLVEWTKYINLGDWDVISEDAFLKLVFLIQ